MDEGSGERIEKAMPGRLTKALKESADKGRPDGEKTGRIEGGKQAERKMRKPAALFPDQEKTEEAGKAAAGPEYITLLYREHQTD